MLKTRLFIAGMILSFTAIPAFALKVTCEQGSESVCSEYCDHAGGGMSSNPDGSVTCTVLAAKVEKALRTPMKRKSIAKIKGNLGDLQCVCKRGART